MGKGDGQRPRFVPYDQYASNYDRIFGGASEAIFPEQQAPAGEDRPQAKSRSEYKRLKAQGFEPEPPPWDDETMDECPACFEIDCICDWQRIEDEYRE